MTARNKMSKEKLEIGVTLVGVAIFAVVVIGNFKPKSSGRKAADPAAGAASQQQPGPALKTGPDLQLVPAAQQELSLQKERSELVWGRDPFSPSKSGLEYQRSDLELKGISVGKDKAGFVFINNEIVKTGDKIGGYEVGEVEKDRVLLKKSGQSFYLTMPGE